MTISPRGAPSDRLVITFAAVPYFGPAPSATFQAELIFEGPEAGTISVTWGYLNPDHTASKVVLEHFPTAFVRRRNRGMQCDQRPRGFDP